MVVLQVKVRLPGTVHPVNYLSQSQKTGSELMLDLAEQYSIQDHSERRLVWSPTVKNPGRIIAGDEIVQQPDHEETCLELWILPSEIRVGMFPAVGNNIVGLREIAVDIRSPLYFMIPIFQKAFQINEPFSFKYSETNSLTNSRWLNANYPLKDQLFGTEGCLLIYPTSNLTKHLSSIPIQKEGFLIKRSRKSKNETPKDSNDDTSTDVDKTFANEKKRWFVLRESFLFYYKNKEAQEKGPHRVIPLEYYVAKIHTSRGKDNKNKVTLTITRSFQGFPQLREDLLLKVEPVKGPIDNTAEQLKDWHEAVKIKCVPLKNTKIFGVDLKQLMSRNRADPNANPIPEIVRKAVAYLDCFGLEVEGILRQSGSGSLVEFYKDQFDQGVPVDLMKVQDPHVVASLLKMYLRELPEPLLTYDLYEEFIQSHAKNIDKTERATKLTALVGLLPVENQIILKYLASFLKRVTQFAQVNKMNKTNLGTVFGPNLLRPRSFEENPQKYLQDNPIINDITQTLIDEYQLFFQDSGNNPPPKKKSNTIVHSGSDLRSSGNFSLPKPPVKSGTLPPTPLKNKYSSIGKSSKHELIKEGYLNKRAEAKDKWKENWVKCYKNRLQFFNSAKDKTPKRTVELHSATVGTSSEKQYCLVLNDGTRLYYLCASSAPEFEDWFQLLKTITEMVMDNNNTPSLNNSSSGTVTPPEPGTPKPAKELPNPPKPASSSGSLERSFSGRGLPTPPGSLPRPPTKRPDLPASFLQKSASTDNASVTATPHTVSDDVQELKAALHNEVQARQALEQEVHRLSEQLQEEAKERKKLEALVMQLAQKIEAKAVSSTPSQVPKLPLPLKSGSKPPSAVSSPTQSPQISPRSPLPATPTKSASLKRVKAIYDNTTTDEDDELAFKEGDIITVVKEDDGSGWFVGSLAGKQGLVPTTYVSHL